MEVAYQVKPVNLATAQGLENASLAELEQTRKDWIAGAYNSRIFDRLETLALAYGKPIYNKLRHEYLFEFCADLPGGEQVRLYFSKELGGWVPKLQESDIIRTWNIVIGGHLEMDNLGTPIFWAGGARRVCFYVDYKSIEGVTYKNGLGGSYCFIVPGPWLDRLLEYAAAAEKTVGEIKARKEEEERQKLLKMLCVDLL